MSPAKDGNDTDFRNHFFSRLALVRVRTRGKGPEVLNNTNILLEILRDGSFILLKFAVVRSLEIIRDSRTDRDQDLDTLLEVVDVDTAVHPEKHTMMDWVSFMNLCNPVIPVLHSPEGLGDIHRVPLCWYFGLGSAPRVSWRGS